MNSSYFRGSLDFLQDSKLDSFELERLRAAALLAISGAPQNILLFTLNESFEELGSDLDLIIFNEVNDICREVRSNE